MSEVTLPALRLDEDTFCLAVIECGGNLAAAYKQSIDPNCKIAGAKARELMTRPEIAHRIHQLQIALEEHSMVSLGSHLTKLAEIRDLSIASDQLKTALMAEKARGEAAGFYSRSNQGPKDLEDGIRSVHIHIGSSPSNNQEWAAKHGRAPVIIDVAAKEGGPSGP
jgi:hypothetical protein